MAAHNEEQITRMQRQMDRLGQRVHVLQENVLRERWAAFLWSNLPATLELYREHLFSSDVTEQMDAMFFIDNFNEDGLNDTLRENITSLYESLFEVVAERMGWQPWREHSLDEQFERELVMEAHYHPLTTHEEWLDLMEEHEQARIARDWEWHAESTRRRQRLYRVWRVFEAAGVDMRVFEAVPIFLQARGLWP